jgi:hypothetical protein
MEEKETQKETVFLVGVQSLKIMAAICLMKKEISCKCFVVVPKYLWWHINCEHLKCHEFLLEVMNLLYIANEPLPRILLKPEMYNINGISWNLSFSIFERLSKMDREIFIFDSKEITYLVESALNRGYTPIVLTFFKSLELHILSDVCKCYGKTVDIFILNENGVEVLKKLPYFEYELILLRRALANYGVKHNLKELSSLYSVYNFFPMEKNERFSIVVTYLKNISYYNMQEIIKHITFKPSFKS